MFALYRRPLVLFSLMFGIICLLNVNYNILKGARTTLAVAGLEQGAGSIPFFELFGTMPGSVLMVYLLMRLLNRYSIHKVFLITLAIFLGFFLFFAIGIYPSLSTWEGKLLQWTWMPGHTVIAYVLPRYCSMLFFVMAELWKIALLTVLFWGLVNQYIQMNDAKRFYAPLMLGGSVGTIIAGPIISVCTSNTISHSWTQSFALMMFAVSLIGILTAWCYFKLWKEFAGPKKEVEEPKESLSVWESIQVCRKSKYLKLLAWITIADYIAYTLGEVIFLDILKKKYPGHLEYCNYQGNLIFWCGLMTAVSALVITPYLLKKCRWVVASQVTPACILLTESAFFIALWTSSSFDNLELLVFTGTAFYCLVRAAKFTLFDSSKELSFILLPPVEKMQGKLIIDGLCSRMGRGGASMMSILLTQVCGGVLASASIVGVLVIGIAVSCVMSTFKLGLLVEKKSAPCKNLA